MRLFHLAYLPLLLLNVSIFAQAPSTVLSLNQPHNHPEYKAVEMAILDYVEGLYDVDSTRIEKSVHPEMRKRGYWYDKKKKMYHDNLDMTYDQLVHLAANWNKSGKRANADTPKKIEIYDINDRTASAKLTAAWGIDYFHLSKLDDKWVIMNVLWQSITKEEKE